MRKSPEKRDKKVRQTKNRSQKQKRWKGMDLFIVKYLLKGKRDFFGKE